jgi:plastocyanin
MGRILGIFIVLVLLAVGMFYFTSQLSSDDVMAGGLIDGSSVIEDDSMIDDSNSGDVIGNDEENSGVDRVFILTGENFKFVGDGGRANPELVVNEGDRVRIEFTSTSGFHDWVVDEFDAATKQIRDGEGMTSVEFIADKSGTFEYYCSVGQHRANGMKGILIVQ